MGDRSAEMLNIMIAIIAIVALMALGFAIFTISKRMANNSQNDLVNQLGQISNSLYTDLDQAVITGARLKGVVGQATTTDCSILVCTLGWLGVQSAFESNLRASSLPTNFQGAASGKAEASLNGNIEYDMRTTAKPHPKAPVVVLEDMALTTSLGTVITYPLAVNFGSILKNGVVEPANDSAWGNDGTEYTSVFHNTKGSAGMALESIKNYDDTAEYAQSIRFKDGEFTTKLEYATNLKNSRILRYDMTSDFTKTGKTFSIPDTAQFNSYVLKNTAGEYMGLVFTQIRK